MKQTGKITSVHFHGVLLAVLCFQPVFLPRADVVRTPSRTIGLGSLWAMTISSDGRFMATAGGQGVFLWDLTSGKVIRRYKADQGLVRRVAISHNGERIVAGGESGPTPVWELASGTLLGSFETPSYVQAVAFSPDGSKLLASSSDVRMWDVASGSLELKFDGRPPVGPVGFMQSGQQIFTTSSANSGVTHFWDVRSGELVRTESLGILCTSPDGSIAVDGDMQVWELATGDLVGALPKAWPYWLTAASISKDNKRVLLAYSADGISNDNPVQLRDLASGTLHQEFNGHEDWVVDVCFLDEHRILTASRDNTVRQWDAATGQTTRQYPGHVDPVHDIAMSADGKIILTAGARTDLGELEYQRVPELRLWNASSGQPIRTVTFGPLSRIDAVAISPDGLRAASSEGSSKVVLWDVSTGSPVRAYPLDGYSGGRLQFSPDGRKLLVKACGAAVHIVDLEVGDALSTLGTGSGGCVSDACFSPDSFKVLASGGNDHAYVWDLMTRERVLSLLGHADYVSAVSWSPDGTKLLTGSWDQTVRLWNAADGTLIETFNVGQVNDEVQSVDFSPDGSLIVVGWSRRPVAQLWRIDRKELLRTVEWPTTPGSSGPTRFFPSGFHFLSADLHVWEIRDLLAKPRLTRSHNDHQIHWDLGTLQFAPSVNGPWTALPAASPLRLSTIGEKGFFRVKVE